MARWIRVLCGVFAALLLAAAAVIWTTTDYLWFRKLGFAEVFRVSYGVRWAMFGVAGGFVALVTGFSAGLARALRPPQWVILPDMLVLSGLARARAAGGQRGGRRRGGPRGRAGTSARRGSTSSSRWRRPPRR